MTYRDDLDALANRVTSLEQEATTATKNLTDARRLLAEAEDRRRLPVLDNIHIAAPCHADWARMSGDDRTRHCSQCEKNVYNLSSMTRAEAEALLIEKEGKLCVRFYQRADGTILTADCPDGLARRRRRRRVIAVTFGAMSAVAAAGTMLRGMMMMGAPCPTRPAMQGAAATITPPQPVQPKAPTFVMGEPAPQELKGHISVSKPKAR
jgi:hypothetical protein